MHLRREPEIGVDPPVVALAMPALGLDLALGPSDRFVTLAGDRVVDHAARRDDVQRLHRRSGGVKYACHISVIGSKLGASSGSIELSFSVTRPASQSKCAVSRL